MLFYTLYILYTTVIRVFEMQHLKLFAYLSIMFLIFIIAFALSGYNLSICRAEVTSVF